MRAIYNAYLGWFDGNPTHLHPLPPRQRAARTAALMGGAQAVLAAARQALGEGEYQWCLELCDLAADSCPCLLYTSRDDGLVLLFIGGVKIGHVAVELGGAGVDHLVSVSYTHLDVYKRQLPFLTAFFLKVPSY